MGCDSFIRNISYCYMATKRTLDQVFSEYIRKRDADTNGFIRCISCGKVVKWDWSDCGHFISRKYNITRYNEENCNAQCRSCNRDDGNLLGYRKGLNIKYGPDTDEKLYAMRHKTTKLGKFEIDILHKMFKSKLEKINKEKPLYRTQK